VIQKSKIDFHRAIIFHVSTFLSVGYFTGVSNFFAAYYNPVRSLTTFKSVAVQNLWPNIQTTVAELNSVELSRVVGQLGGQLVVVLSLIGTVYAVYLAYKKKEYVIGLNLLFWWVASLYTTGQGIRFILLVIFPFIIGLGYFLKLVLFDLSRIFDNYFKIPSSIGSATSGLLIFMILLPGILAGVQVAQQSVPSMDDGWYNSLTYINDNMDENVIITSWWDFGYWFRSVAERPVTFDGGTQVGYNAYWVGKALSADEYTSTGIIRMLNCGQNTAFETLIPELDDYQVTIDLLEDLVVLPYADAEQELLNQGLPTTVLQYTHCDAPQSVVIASGDMVSKAGVWAHFGAWNYTKAKMYQDVHALDVNAALNMLQNDYGLESSSAVVEFNLMQAGGDQYISPYPQLLTSFTCTGDESMVCNVNYQNLNVRIDYDLVTGEFNYTGNYEVDHIIIDNYTIPRSSGSGLSIKIDTATNKGYLGSNEVVDGLFANMYYLQSSDCYELAYTGQSNSAGNVMVWLSDYSCLE